MKRKLDLDKVEAALKKAGRDALTGPRDIRSGKFVGRDATSGKFVETVGPHTDKLRRKSS